MQNGVPTKFNTFLSLKNTGSVPEICKVIKGRVAGTTLCLVLSLLKKRVRKKLSSGQQIFAH